MISFVTNNRAVANSDGTFEYVRWSALRGDYQLSKNGVRHPTQFQAVWNNRDVERLTTEIQHNKKGCIVDGSSILFVRIKLI